MVHVYKATGTKVVTKIVDGKCEVSIGLDLNININGVPAENVTSLKIKPKFIEDDVDDKPAWIMPNFGSKEKIQFGKVKKEGE